MIVTISREQAAQRRRHYTTPGGTRTVIDTYLGTSKIELVAEGQSELAAADPRRADPMAYLVSQAADSVVQAHYHEADQFQLFVAGDGRIGTHALRPVTVHYAGAYSPYGPILSGPSGLSYVTLRRSWDPGAKWMPEAAAALRSIPHRRHAALTSEHFDCCSDSQRRLLRGVSMSPLLDSTGDGLGAWLIRAGPGAAIEGPDPAAGNGQFWYVLSGECVHGGSAAARDGCIFVSEDERALAGVAGATGVEMLLVQFGRPGA